ncbi:MAG TPA: class I SAM-dependent methyltransferase [Xanthobacteraceae bacterium]|nr:class I SAM-dependent methyltransferase [Xanthobacteraceae bacterium]
MTLATNESAHAAARMNRMYRRQRRIYDFSRKFYLLGRDGMIRGLHARNDMRVLEIGCGTARNLIVAAKRYPDAEFFGIDISAEMLATAAANIAREKLGDAIEIACADAAAFDPKQLFGVERFERVFISYSLSMIPVWRAVLERAVSVLAPHGELHVVDFGDQERLPRWFGRGLQRWLQAFDVSPRRDLELQLQALADYHGAELHFERIFRGYAQYAVLRFAQAAA